MVGFAMFSRGHVHDTTVPVRIGSWGALEFFKEILKKDAAVVNGLFELWAATKERGTWTRFRCRQRRTHSSGLHR